VRTSSKTPRSRARLRFRLSSDLELVRGLAERGITGDAPRADTANVLPDTVHAAVLARLDLLSPQERSVVQVASVSGRTFRPATLQAVMEDLTAACSKIEPHLALPFVSEKVAAMLENRLAPVRPLRIASCTA